MTTDYRMSLSDNDHYYHYFSVIWQIIFEELLEL